jgi:hypothetical protein
MQNNLKRLQEIQWRLDNRGVVYLDDQGNTDSTAYEDMEFLIDYARIAIAQEIVDAKRYLQD